MKRELEVPKPSIQAVFEHYGLRVVGADRGGWRKAQCPLPEHEDQNPSATINEDLCRWHCHACGESGDAVDLISRRDSVGFGAAVKLAASFVDGEGAQVRGERGEGGLLPRSAGHRPGRRNWSPPWTRL